MAEVEGRRVTSLHTLLRAIIMLAAAILILTALTTVAIVRLVDQAASQQQLESVQADSCHVFEFVDQRFLTPTKTETAKQRAITAQFAGQLNRAVRDCVRAGYSDAP